MNLSMTKMKTKMGQKMNDNYYQIDICFNFESKSDKKAMDYFLKTMTVANIPLKNAQLKKFKRNCIGDFGTYIYPNKDDEDD